MNILEKFIGFISPKWALSRESSRCALDGLRSYEAGNTGSPIMRRWQTVNQPAELEMSLSRDQVRAAARNLEQNSDVMNAILCARERNVIGKGFSMQAKTPKEKINSEIEKKWARWCRGRNCDITGEQSLLDLIRMAVRRKAVDGGILIIKRYLTPQQVQAEKRMLPFVLQMVEVDQIDVGAMNPKDAAGIHNGVEYNEYNKPVAYWIRTYSADGLQQMQPVRVPAEDVIFYHSKERPTQLREMSDMADTVLRIRELNELVHAYGQKQLVEACFAVFLTTDTPLDGQGFGRSMAQAPPEPKNDFDGRHVEPGLIGRLRQGEKPHVINPTGQAADAASMVKLMLRIIGAGQGMSYESISRDLSETNYSSARQGAIEDELAFSSEVDRVLAILDEIYETFVISLVMSGQLSISPERFWARKEEYLAHDWIKVPKKWVDPVKEANATATALSSGVVTYQQTCAQNGTDWKENLDATKEILEYADKIGLNVAGALYAGQMTLAEEEPESAGTGPPGQDDPAQPEGGDDGGADDTNSKSAVRKSRRRRRR